MWIKLLWCFFSAMNPNGHENIEYSFWETLNKIVADAAFIWPSNSKGRFSLAGFILLTEYSYREVNEDNNNRILRLHIKWIVRHERPALANRPPANFSPHSETNLCFSRCIWTCREFGWSLSPAHSQSNKSQLMQPRVGWRIERTQNDGGGI